MPGSLWSGRVLSAKCHPHACGLAVVQSLSCVRLFATPWTTARQASLSFTISRSLLKLMSTELVMPSNHLIFCRPLLLPPSIFLSIRVFSNEQALRVRWPKYWSFSFSISLSNEHSGLISFRIDWLALLAVQGTLKSLLQSCVVLIILILISPVGKLRPRVVKSLRPGHTAGKQALRLACRRPAAQSPVWPALCLPPGIPTLTPALSTVGPRATLAPTSHPPRPSQPQVLSAWRLLCILPATVEASLPQRAHSLPTWLLIKQDITPRIL